MATLLFKNEYIEIMDDAELVYIKSSKQGLSLDMFNSILRSHFPYIKITNFNNIKKVLMDAPAGPELFAEKRSKIGINISADNLKAYMTLFVAEDELSFENRSTLLKEILEALNDAEVVYGINSNILMGPLKSGIEYLIASGLPAINGEDSDIKLFEIAVPQPKIINSGNVNHYELNLINHVKEGDWLGERKDSTPGFPGKNVKGTVILPIPGRTFPLVYDRISVREEYQDGITTLLSMKTGAVYYRGDTIGVYDFLEIKGDIDFSTGNIDFDGFLSIKGTVYDHFTVTAEKDIEILGEYGVGAADKINSREGNIYIKGGISGKGKALVQCKKNLYVKYLSDITVECEGSVYVGFYCINANIRAKQVIVESPKGRITGGQIDADICVSAADIGNRSEMRTEIIIRGFDRNMFRSDLEKLSTMLKEKKDDLTSTKQHLQSYSSSGKLTQGQNNDHENLKAHYVELMDAIKELEYQYKNMNDYLKTPGEGAVVVKNRLYPRVKIQIKGLREEITSETAMITYSFKDNQLIKI